jgi:hypothetical protein
MDREDEGAEKSQIAEFAAPRRSTSVQTHKGSGG